MPLYGAEVLKLKRKEERPFGRNSNHDVETGQACDAKVQKKRSVDIGGDLGVENNTLKARQTWLRWCGYILEMD